MDTLVIEKSVRKEQNFRVSFRPVVEQKKKSFEQAVAECKGRPVREFFDELRRQVKEYYKNA